MSIRPRSPDSSQGLLSESPVRSKTPQKYVESRLDNVKGFLKTRAGCVLICGIIAFLTAYLFCKQAFWRDPDSWFYSEDGVYEFKYSRQRQAVAHEFIKEANSTLHTPKHGSAELEPVICVAVETVKRKKSIDYLNGTIGSMLAGLTPEERSLLSVQILFLDASPEIHSHWNATWLNTVDNWSSYNLSSEKIEELRHWRESQQLQRKTMFDYAYTLEHCLNYTSAPYIAVVEDDVIFAEGWLPKALSALGDIRQKSIDWLDFRLFYTEAILGWDSDLDSWYTHPIFLWTMSITVLMSLTITVYTVHKRNHADGDYSTFLVVGCVLLPLMVSLLFMIGKNSLIPLHGVHRMDVKGCCNQALIYPRHKVREVAKMLYEHQPGASDLVVDKWAAEKKLARYAITPQTVQHIGLVSTRGMPKKFTRSTWAYYFEASNAEQLAREHEQLARWGIWRTTDTDYALPAP